LHLQRPLSNQIIFYEFKNWINRDSFLKSINLKDSRLQAMRINRYDTPAMGWNEAGMGVLKAFNCRVEG